MNLDRASAALGKTVVHPTALVEKGVDLGEGVFVGPFCVISSGARIGTGTVLRSHVVISGHCELGAHNVVHPFCVIGGEPQDMGYKGEDTRVVIGDHNTFREGVSIHRGTPKDRGVTSVGSHNFLMAHVHVAHDCMLKDHIVIANGTQLAGHVEIQERVIMGGLSGIQQKGRIGAFSFVGGATAMRRDLPPFMAAKEFSTVSGPNLVGLKRSGMSDTNIRVVSDLYKIFYLANLTVEKALGEIEAKYPENECARQFVEFVRGTKIGVQR